MELIENTQIEFKREYTEMIKKEVVAFANTQGGTIFIGIDDDGAVVGLPDPDKTLLQVANMLHNAIRPDLTLFSQCSIVEMQGQSVVKIEVQRGTGRPYYMTEKGLKPAGVYTRVGSASMPVSTDVIRAMIKETDGETFETTRSMNQDLTFAAARMLFRAYDDELDSSSARALGLVGSDGLYTNLALLLSDQCQHSIRLAIFDGTDKNRLLLREEFTGSLLEQYREVYDYLDDCNGIQAEAVHAALPSGLNYIYPDMAVKEALLNAIVHRDYSLSGSTLISLFDDRLEFVSLGGLVQGIAISDIPLGVSLSRNERLANVFYRLQLVDTCGAGIARINGSYTDFARQPEFVATEGVFVTRLPNRGYQEPG